MNHLLGIHHVTAMTDSAERNYDFVTKVLGMRLVKKTVNQDDIHTYHTYFADDRGNAGTDLTFFDFPNLPQGIKGTNSISRIGLRVKSDAALEYYRKRFDEHNIKHDEIKELFGSKVLPFEEADGQAYQIFSDEHNEGIPGGIPWKKGPVPEDMAIYGLGPIEITVGYFDEFKTALTTIYEMRIVEEHDDVALLEVGEGGHGGQVILRKDSEKQAQQGYGLVHHVSFRVADEDAINAWMERYHKLEIGNSGIVDRYYFKALYARIGHILIEISTDGPGFMGDESYEHLGETLSLPPFLENQRESIESQVRPFDTIWKGE
ncbi:ring-cleaving dioxygenase [Facklamia miroungae]|uniref:Glyoxalase family protein n=1 Tax=Facklamia miroungae TaxID=120956 RepID=A0A1G7QH38_9LACT|nr:ring-cleaving dioxygenase [Facklamia miroungae]NKZ28938.1 ring-cleaving dioxygenase [Facklamia miroungae]SDF97796.1 glyoxalase family protein [Facklamia miroungae]